MVSEKSYFTIRLIVKDSVWGVQKKARRIGKANSRAGVAAYEIAAQGDPPQ